MFTDADPANEKFTVVAEPEIAERVAVTIAVPPSVEILFGVTLKVTVGATLVLVNVRFTELGDPAFPFTTELMEGITVRSGL